MKILRSNDPFTRPSVEDHSIFLVGPTPRREGVASWRPEALDILSDIRYNGWVYVPEPFANGRDVQIRWETLGLMYASVIACWLCRDLETMPAFTSNHEFAEWFHEQKFVYGRPDGTPHTNYQDERYLYRGSRITGIDSAREAAERYKFGNKPHTTLRSLLVAATEGYCK